MANIKKMSVANVYGKIDLEKLIEASKSDGPGLKIMRVLGQAVGQKQGESAFGPWTALLGRFEATNLETGEASEASTLFLPEVAMVPIQVAMASGPVTFAVDIFAKYVKNGKPGGVPYEYTFEHVTPPAENDPIRVLKAQIAAQQAALQAPKDEPAPSNDKGKGKGK